jgi:catechol 2,3-dioxygenase-like lactoylglutathione lyase family enzyme
MYDVLGIDHIYFAVTDLARSEAYYDIVLRDTLGFRKNRFALNGAQHVQYYNRHFGVVLRPAKSSVRPEAGSVGLHHFCFRVQSIGDVQGVAARLVASGIAATEARNFPEYAPDYWATFFEDPDGLRLEVTNYRQERRERHDRWELQLTP